MRRYYGSDDEDDADVYEESDKGSPMHLSRGTATPIGRDPDDNEDRNTPWMTDNGDIRPAAIPSTKGGERSPPRPEWMTRSQEVTPAAEVQGPRAKKRLGFEGLPGPRATEETDGDTVPVLPPSPSPLRVRPAVSRPPVAAVRPIRPGDEPDLFDVDPWGDVDFARLAREQANQADRLGRPRPSDKFLGAETEYPDAAGRLERVLHRMLEREKRVPVVVLYAHDPDLDVRERPVMLWRSAPGPSRLVLHMAVIDHYDRTRYDTRLAVNGPASVGVARIDLFTESAGPAHFHLRSKDDEWLLEAGAFLPMERVIVILIQENFESQPLMLDLQPLRFDQSAITAPASVSVSAPASVDAKANNEHCDADYFEWIRLVDGLGLMIMLESNGTLTWVRNQHESASPSDREKQTRRVNPSEFRKLACLNEKSFEDNAGPTLMAVRIDDDYHMVEKMVTDHGPLRNSQHAPIKSVPKLVKALKALVARFDKQAVAISDWMCSVDTNGRSTIKETRDRCDPSEWMWIRLGDGRVKETIRLDRNGRLTWHRGKGAHYVAYVEPSIYRRLVCADNDKFGPVPRSIRAIPFDEHVHHIVKLETPEGPPNGPYEADMEKVPDIAKTLRDLVAEHSKDARVHATPDDWVEIRYLDSFALEITVHNDGSFTWRRRRHPLSSLKVDETLHSGTMEPWRFRYLTRYEAEEFDLGPVHMADDGLRDKSYAVITKVDSTGQVYTAPANMASGLARDLIYYAGPPQ